jgi:hypothetical protein
LKQCGGSERIPPFWQNPNPNKTYRSVCMEGFFAIKRKLSNGSCQNVCVGSKSVPVSKTIPVSEEFYTALILRVFRFCRKSLAPFLNMASVAEPEPQDVASYSLL